MSVRFRIIIVVVALAGAVWKLWPTWDYYQLNKEREPLAEAYTKSAEAYTGDRLVADSVALALAADSLSTADSIVLASAADSIALILATESVQEAADRLALAQWDSLYYKDWEEAKANRIKLGLDLRGGVYTTIEVDIPALLYETADKDLIDEAFENVMAAVREEARLSDDPVIDIFSRKFDEVARPQNRTLFDYYELGDLPGDAGDDAIIEKLKDNINDAVDQAEEVIRQRIDKYGLTEPSIQQQGSRRIIVELPDEKDPERVRNLLSQTARLEFKLVRNDAAIVEVFKQIDEVLAAETPLTDADTPDTDNQNTDTGSQTSPPNDTANPDEGAPEETTDDTMTVPDDTTEEGNQADTTSDTTNPFEGLTEEEQIEKYRALHPFTTNFTTLYQQAYQTQRQDASGIYDLASIPAGEYTFYISKEGIKKVRKILLRPEVRGLIPEDRLIAFSANPDNPNDPESPFELIVLNAEPEMKGEVVTDAYEGTDPMTGNPTVTMTMNLAGAERWGEITGANVEKRVAVVLDSAVYSAPWIQEKIPGGQTRITGSTDLADAELLATVLKSGALKAPIKIIEERIVGPSLGSDQIDQGVEAILFAALLVIIFMILYYAVGGVVADLAVALNVFFSLAFLAALQGTLTLPGIGALVLTIGMAVDANILIYERIREELALGKTIRNAVQLGYEKAFSAIIDSNITTFIIGLILAAFGTGPIKGFAVMLMIGIAGTLFTAVFITRAVFMLVLERDIKSINFGQPKSQTI